MSKKPTITIRYPEASEKALKLTEAMVKRSPGKRVVETESEDPIFPDGGDLFSSFIRCKTSTGVDLTLTLNPASMDFALETLICPNLNAEERKRILGDTASSEEALPGLAPTDDPTKEQKKQIQIGKISESDLRKLFLRLMEEEEQGVERESAIEDAINDVNDMIADAEWHPYQEIKETQREAETQSGEHADPIKMAALYSKN